MRMSVYGQGPEFSRLGYLDGGFITLRWSLRFHGLSEMEMSLPFDSDLWAILSVGNIICLRDIGRTFIIYAPSVFINADGSRIITIRAVGSGVILNYRVVSKDYTNLSVTEIVAGILRDNFTAPSNLNRKVPELEIGNLTIPQTVESVIGEYRFAGDIIFELAQKLDFGVETEFNPKTKKFKFSAHSGVVRPEVIFSTAFNNITTVERYLSDESYRNVVYLTDLEQAPTVYNDVMAGLNRREAAKSYDSRSAFSRLAQAQKAAALFPFIDNVSADLDIISSQYQFQRDWDLGDIITIRDETLDLKCQKRVVGVEEFTGQDKYYMSVVLADRRAYF